jgi:hypothetical protein
MCYTSGIRDEPVVSNAVFIPKVTERSARVEGQKKPDISNSTLYQFWKQIKTRYWKCIYWKINKIYPAKQQEQEVNERMI